MAGDDKVATISAVHMSECSAEECRLIAEHERKRGEMWQPILDELRRIAEIPSPYRVNRLEHMLQTATRAELAGADDDMVVGALLHDIGDLLCPRAHEQFAGSILQPYVHEEALWVVRHHGAFIGFHYWHHLGRDRNIRENFRDSPWFDSAVRFAEWDELSFDPDFATKTLDEFVPLLDRVFSRKPYGSGHWSSDPRARDPQARVASRNANP